MGKSRKSESWATRNVKALCLAAFGIGVLALAVTALNTVQNSAVATTEPRPNAVASRSAEPLPGVAVTRTAGEDMRVLFAGDSLTGGLYASQQSLGFRTLMLNQLQASGGVDAFDSAISGGTTVEVAEKYEVPADLDLAIVELGTNDLGRATELPVFDAAYDELLSRVTTGSPGVALVCAGVWEANGGSDTGSSYDQIIRSSCEDAGGVFVSLRSIYATSADVIGPAGIPAYTGLSDDFHPNDRGHERIAEALLGRITIS